MAGHAFAFFQSLPNELLLHSLSIISNRELIPIARVSKRFYALVCRVLYSRIRMAVPLPDYNLLLECYHPSLKISEPSLHTTYLNTPGLEELGQDVANLPNDRLVGEIGKMLNLYSRFKPHVERRGDPSPPRHPAGDIPGSRTWDLTHPSTPTEDGHVWERVIQHLHLESHELFTQLVATVMMYREDFHTGSYLELHALEEDKTMRVWRDWLANMAKAEDGRPSLREASPETAKRSDFDSSNLQDDARILWTTPAQNFGLRLAIRKSDRQPHQPHQLPVLMHVDEEDVAYEIEYQEMLVRTSFLMDALDQVSPHGGRQPTRMVVFGSYR